MRSGSLAQRGGSTQAHLRTRPDGAAQPVRMGLHPVSPTPYVRDYIGLDVSRAARGTSSAMVARSSCRPPRPRTRPRTEDGDVEVDPVIPGD
jgi:hypothetical protein